MHENQFSKIILETIASDTYSHFKSRTDIKLSVRRLLYRDKIEIFSNIFYMRKVFKKGSNTDRLFLFICFLFLYLLYKEVLRFM